MINDAEPRRAVSFDVLEFIAFPSQSSLAFPHSRMLERRASPLA